MIHMLRCCLICILLLVVGLQALALPDKVLLAAMPAPLLSSFFNRLYCLRDIEILHVLFSASLARAKTESPFIYLSLPVRKKLKARVQAHISVSSLLH